MYSNTPVSVYIIFSPCQAVQHSIAPVSIKKYSQCSANPSKLAYVSISIKIQGVNPSDEVNTFPSIYVKPPLYEISLDFEEISNFSWVSLVQASS